MTGASCRWDGFYSRTRFEVPPDHWLAGELEILKPTKTLEPRDALELGCGRGFDAATLIQAGFRVTACDHSAEAVALTRERAPRATVCQVDLADPLPWDANDFDLVVSSLSLHYYRWKKTMEIVSEIRRVLRPRGVLIGRVNSTLDVNHGAGAGRLIEPGLRGFDGYQKRFFSEDDVQRMLTGWAILSLRPEQTMRIKQTKEVIAFRAVADC